MQTRHKGPIRIESGAGVHLSNDKDRLYVKVGEPKDNAAKQTYVHARLLNEEEKEIPVQISNAGSQTY